jgi:shikimate kinase
VEYPLAQELAPFRDCVVATGGGAVLRPDNWGHMSHAVSVWLDGPPPLLAARLVADGTASRPLVAGSEVRSVHIDVDGDFTGGHRQPAAGNGFGGALGDSVGTP